MKVWLRVAVVALLLIAFNAPAASAQEESSGGFTTVVSDFSVDETVDRITAFIEDRGLALSGVIAHDEVAASIDEELRPTRLIVFGNPNLGTPLMVNSRTVGLDLPQKMLVWEDESGQVNVSYNSVDYLVNRHGLTGPDDVLETIEGALAAIASQSQAPEDGGDGGDGGDDGAAADGGDDAGASDEGTTGAETELAETGRETAVVAILGISMIVLGGYALLTSRRVLRGFGSIVVGLAVVAASTVGAPDAASAQSMPGVITIPSEFSTEETLQRIQDEAEARDFRIALTIAHATAAEAVGLELPPTFLVTFGRPDLNIALMQESQTFGLDLPQKMLVWEADDGSVNISYNDEIFLAERHGITEQTDTLSAINEIIASIAEAAAQG